MEGRRGKEGKKENSLREGTRWEQGRGVHDKGKEVRGGRQESKE